MIIFKQARTNNLIYFRKTTFPELCKNPIQSSVLTTIQIQAPLLSGLQHKDCNYTGACLFLCRFLSLSLSLMVSTVGDTEIHNFKCIMESQQLSFIIVSLSFFCCALFLPRTCANVCTMSQGQKGFERVSQTNRH